MRRKLRFATTLRGQETQRDHFALAGVESAASVVVAEAVVGQPLVDVPGLQGKR